MKFLIRFVSLFILNKKKRKAFRNKYIGKKGVKTIYSDIISRDGIIYKGRPEAGPLNFCEKLKRVDEGGFFEWPDMIATNKVISLLLAESDKKVLNIGAGTGTFEIISSEKYPDKEFVASEFDKDCVKWCKENRQKDNISYTSLTFDELKEKYNKFDCVVSADVIEHIDNYADFIRSFIKISDKAIIATPNKDRNIASALTDKPNFYQHTFEWTAGELYWVLKSFYHDVKLYSYTEYPNKEDLNMKVEFKEVGLYSSYEKLIAVCERPIQVK